MEINKIYLDNCMTFMDTMSKNSVDLTLTDIPYGEVNRSDNGLRNLSRGIADETTFELIPFLDKVYYVTKSTIIIFCGKGQFSTIYNYFAEKQEKKKGTVRELIWQKCLSASTEIPLLTSEGLMTTMSIKDIARGNFKNYKLFNGEKWVPLIDCKETESVEEYIQITLRNGNNIKCTENHRFKVNGKLIEAKDLSIGSILEHCQIKNKKENIENYPFYLNKDILWFIGLYLGDGSLSGETIQISANINDNNERERLKRICKSFNCHLREYQSSENGTQYCIDCKILYNILKEYIAGNTAYGKHFSTKALNLPNDFIKEIIEGYLYADGHWEEENNRWVLGFTAKNQDLQKDLRFISNLLGYDIKLQKTITKAFNAEFKTIRGSLRYETSNHFNAKSSWEIAKIERVKNNHNYKFYDLVLEDEPHLFVLHDGTITHNSNPSPLNGQYIYLSGVENAVWFKKRGGVFNAHCKNTVFKHPAGSSKLHPTEKNHELLKELILDNSNENDIVFDPCAGSGAHCLVAKESGRRYIGIDCVEKYYDIMKTRGL